MKTFLVYRTDKGNLSFKENGESIFTIRTGTLSNAQKALAALKRMEKETDIRL